MIPLVNLRRQIELLAPELKATFAQLLEQTDFIGGQAVRDFEAAFAEYCGVSHCVGVGNGTDALYLIFRALEYPAGSEIITSPMTFIATAEMLSLHGLKTVFADINPDTYLMDPETIARQITPRTKAILPVHLYGQPANLEGLVELAKTHGLDIIEDGSQAHGAEYAGRRVGSLGRAAAFSFYPGKNLGAFGDAGGVTSNDGELVDKIRMLANHGRISKYEHLVEGVNSRLDTIQAAILNIKLRYLDQWNQQRRQLASLYDELLADIPQVHRPVIGPNRTPVYHLYVIRTERRDALLAHLSQRGISAGIHYPLPLHLQPAFSYLGHRRGDFPTAEHMADHCLSLPLYPEMTENEVRLVASEIRAFHGLRPLIQATFVEQRP